MRRSLLDGSCAIVRGTCLDASECSHPAADCARPHVLHSTLLVVQEWHRRPCHRSCSYARPCTAPALEHTSSLHPCIRAPLPLWQAQRLPQLLRHPHAVLPTRLMQCVLLRGWCQTLRSCSQAVRGYWRASLHFWQLCPPANTCPGAHAAGHHRACNFWRARWSLCCGSNCLLCQVRRLQSVTPPAAPATWNATYKPARRAARSPQTPHQVHTGRCAALHERRTHTCSSQPQPASRPCLQPAGSSCCSVRGKATQPCSSQHSSTAEGCQGGRIGAGSRALCCHSAHHTRRSTSCTTSTNRHSASTNSCRCCKSEVAAAAAARALHTRAV